MMEQQAMHSVKMSGLVVLCLMVGACNQENAEEPVTPKVSGSDRCEAAVREVITLEFTGPNREVTRIKQEVEDMIADIDKKYDGLVVHPGYTESGPEVDAYFAYADETYASYFTEKGYAELTQEEAPKAFDFHLNNLDYRIKPTDVYVHEVEIEDPNQEFSAFNFSAQVDYTTRREGGLYDFTGWALCSPEGKISHLTIIDQDELAERIAEDR